MGEGGKERVERDGGREEVWGRGGETGQEEGKGDVMGGDRVQGREGSGR